MNRLRRLLLALAASAALAGCAGMTVAPQADSTPRIAVMSAFEPELVLLRQKLQDARTTRINGVEFHTGTLQGRPVVLFLSGISMTNATMNTQLALDRFKVSHVVFSGIAGGVNPNLSIGDVTVPAQWGQYLEVLMAKEVAPGRYEKPPFIQDATLPNFGMMFPRPVEFRSAAQPRVTRRFWFEVDPGMLAAARTLKVDLAACAAGTCLRHPPRLVVGGNGVSGQAFMDNKAFREYTYATFQANVLDMETAAVGMVAHANGVPYLAFRSLSDLAGGGDGANEMGTFMRLAADNSAQVLMAFLAQWKP
ncbi:5'-methylthioadenosine/S-adenosylhomocysteine nucleosidase [Pseudacidovorax sp. RU35E]|uniref:5'-methylthioadenosine/S-adenosylhomocysteine nucleosidase n=1 Tax=Pseudacidovorax sp. RU35E TaxID=1907403 RepID=UPI000954776C|nr:5'-methylthioadenosine/S-adenosylhomocysteine nucleosidase [Pseudacidovorax sp. RU35E]SIR30440.1 adenosylhomocysteine nucleosidase [Pseudacidovorax sp. RU35E]